MAYADLTVAPRVGSGKSASRRVRRSGLVPSVIYGPDVTPTSISVNPKELRLALSTKTGLNTILRLKSDDATVNGKLALLADFQKDPVSDLLLHVDLHQVDTKKPVNVSVPIRFVGKAKGVVDGGVLNEVLREIEVACLPDSIPEIIEIDVTELDVGDVVHLLDVKLPEGVKPASTTINFSIVSVTTLREETATPTATTEAAAPAAADATAGKDAAAKAPAAAKDAKAPAKK